MNLTSAVPKNDYIFIFFQATFLGRTVLNFINCNSFLNHIHNLLQNTRKRLATNKYSFVKFLPRIHCLTPRETLDNIQQNKRGNAINWDIVLNGHRSNTDMFTRNAIISLSSAFFSRPFYIFLLRGKHR